MRFHRRRFLAKLRTLARRLWPRASSPMLLPPPFVFLAPGELRDGDLSLVLRETAPPMAGRAPAYRFEMRRVTDGARMGRIELRIGSTQDLQLYTGHIGYRVDLPYRGHRYAARACLLLAELAQRHGHTEIWITCDPDNAASRRTCELTGAHFQGIVPVPKHHLFYQAGSREKCRFRLDLSPVARPLHRAEMPHIS